MTRIPTARRLHCTEVWGGNTVVNQQVSVTGVEAHILSRPFGGPVGGDIHYVSTCAAGLVSRFFLADVSGHDDVAAGVARNLRRLMREHINEVDQSRFTRTINREFGALADAGRFATAILATYFAPTGYFIVCNAGHPPPLWFRASEGRWTVLTPEATGVMASGQAGLGVADLPLGIVEATEYRQFVAPLEPDDLVVLYTDALIEAAPPGGRALGTDGLLALAARVDASDPAAAGQALLAAVGEHRVGPPDDDATVLVLHHTGQEAPAPSLASRIRAWGRRVGVLT